MGIFNKKKDKKSNGTEDEKVEDLDIENKKTNEDKKVEETTESEFSKAMSEINEDTNKEESKEDVKEKEDKKKVKVKEEKEQTEDEEIEEEPKKKAKKESKDYKTYNPILDMKFWFKLIGGVVLVALAFVFIFEKELRERVCIGIFGGIVAVFSIYRIYPTFKYTKKGWAKFLGVVEIIVDLVIGCLLVFGGFNFSESGNDLTEFTTKNFHYFLGVVFYLRGIVYTVCSSLLKEPTNLKNYLINIACLTFGVVVFVTNAFKVDYLAWIMVVLAFASGAYLLGEGGVDYTKYRNHNEQRKKKAEQKKKAREEKKKQKEAEKGEKSHDKEIEKQDRIITPDEKGENKQQDILQ